MADLLRFRLVNDDPVEVGARLGDAEFPVSELLAGRLVWLGDDKNPQELHQHRPVRGARRDLAYGRLDNEILAGRRLRKAAGFSYPPELARLYGYEAVSADPFTLFEPSVGRPLREVCGNLLDKEKEDFQVSLLRGLCWLAVAGLAHRAIGPDTVLWDGRTSTAQIVDFSRCTVFGVARTPVQGTAWVPEEQRAGTAHGRIGPRDDIWAAAQLIFYAHNRGVEFFEPGQLAASGLTELLGHALGEVEARPTAGALLALLGKPNPAAGRPSAGEWLGGGRGRFLEARARKHPGAQAPPRFNEDQNWMRDPASGAWKNVVTTDPRAGAAGPPDADSSPPPSGGEPPDVNIPQGANSSQGANSPQDAAQSPTWAEQETKARSFLRRRGN